MPSLTLNHQAWPIDRLIEDDTLRHHPDLSAYEQRVLQFCRRWLTGQMEFSLQTSGSTGQPKSISLSREQMITSAGLTGQALNLQAGDRALVCLSTDYIAGLMMLVRGFELGLELTVIPPGSNPLADFPTETHFDFTALVPLQLQTMLTTAPDKIPILNRMKAILIGGAPVSLALQDQLQHVTAPIYHTYGMTETVSHIALKRLNGPQADDRFVPLAGVELGRDDRGCLTITAPVTRGERLTTNDLVDLQPDGSFIWLGRIDNVINSGGVKVQLEKVELALEKFLNDYHQGGYAGRRFFAGPLPDARLGQAVVAVIEGQPLPDDATFSHTLQTALRQSLGPYAVPRHIFFVETLLETPTGKIDRAANLARLTPSGDQASPIS